MKKVAIMTWYHYSNFESAFQIVASVIATQKMGYEVDVVRYIPHNKVVTIPKPKNIQYYLMELCKRLKNMMQTDKEKKIVFDDFINRNITLTKECKISSELFDLNRYYDAFICGSDQIWSPSFFNPKYFLDYVDNPNKMIAYASSIGLNKTSDQYVKNRMKANIGRFEYLSSREEQSKNLIKEVCGKDVRVVLDPTLLLNAQAWEEMIVQTKHKEPYILCYFLGNNKKNWAHVKRLSQKLNLPLKVIPIFSKDYKRGYEVLTGVGPGEFLDLIKNTSFICTDSFYGTIFSMNYEKPFYVYERFSKKDNNFQNSGVYSILKIMKLESRLVRNKTIDDDNPLKFDYSNTRKILIEKRAESLSYLENALSESVSYKEDDDPFSITNTCCGCGVCTLACGHNAIEVRKNEDGFIQAIVNQENCTRCKTCKGVCPFNGQGNVKISPMTHNLYMARSTDQTVLRYSSSGGLGYVISRILCEKGYDVIGCTYDKENREAKHQLVSAGCIEKLEIFKGSKYIQSKTHEAFSEMLDKSNKAVVFGLPCQIAGLDKMLRTNKKRESHILVDLICHGVPTQHLWEKYLKEGAEKYGYGLMPDVLFRDKSRGWREMHISVQGNGKVYSKRDKEDMFYRFFLLGHCYMASCYECAYRTASAADIRLGDYWGPRYKKDTEGVSMVIAMTEIGKNILRELNVTNKIQLEEKSCEEYWTVQYPKNPIRPVFYEELTADLKDDHTLLGEIAKKYCKPFEVNLRKTRRYAKYYSLFKIFANIFLNKMRK